MGKSLVVDYHAGCISSLTLALVEAGESADVLSLSGHQPVLEENGVAKYVVNKSLKRLLLWRLWGSERVLALGKNPTISSAVRAGCVISGKAFYDTAWTAFPPALYRRVVRSGIAKRTVVWVSHRADIHISSPSKRKRFWGDVISDYDNGVTFFASNSLDAEYFFQFTRRRIPVVLPWFAYLPDFQKGKEVRTEKPLVVVSPNQESKKEILELKKILGESVIFLGEVYDWYNFETLQNHKAAIIFPYSAYSISLSEFIQVGIPVFIPSDSWLIRNGFLNDVRLFPMYGEEERIRKGDLELVKGPTLNTSSEGEFEDWMKFAAWNHDENKLGIFRWDNFAQLEALVSDVPEIDRPGILQNTNTKRRALVNFIQSL